jgi:outer membrane protein OmpA-like peptidoglycan-associated protein
MLQPSSRAPDLLNLVKREITLQAIGTVATELGEDTERTTTAISVGVPSVLALLSEVASSPNGAAHLEAAIVAKSPEVASGDPVLLDGHAGERAAGFLDRELGSRAWDVSDAMARTSGVKRESAHALLGGVASVTLLAMARNLGPMSSGALRSLLIAQRDEWRLGETSERVTPSFAGDAAPAEVTTERVYATPTVIPEQRLPAQVMTERVNAAPATIPKPRDRIAQRDEWRPAETPERVMPSSAGDTAPAEVKTERVYTAPAILPEQRRRRWWLVPLTLLVAAVIAIPLILGLGRSYRHRTPQFESESTAPQIPPGSPEPAAPVEAPRNPAETAAPTPAVTDLGALLGSAEALPRRFPLPLKFDPGAKQPTAASTGALDEVAAALRAHPSAQIRLESTADGVATTTEADEGLAQSRSEAVKGLLIERGIDTDRITAAAGKSETSGNAHVDLIATGR